MNVHEWEESHDRADDIPEPEVRSAKGIWNATTLDFVANAVAEAMEPYQISDAKSEPPPKEENPEVIGGLASIVFGGNCIDLI